MIGCPVMVSWRTVVRVPNWAWDRLAMCRIFLPKYTDGDSHDRKEDQADQRQEPIVVDHHDDEHDHGHAVFSASPVSALVTPSWTMFTSFGNA